MSSLQDLLNKSKKQEAVRQTQPEKVAMPEPAEPVKKLGFALKLGDKNANTLKQILDDTAETGQVDRQPPSPIETELSGNLDSSDTGIDPFAGLSDALGSIDLNLDEKPEELTYNMYGTGTGQKEETIPVRQFQNPTIDDLSKFVFEEQPDQSTEEICLSFSTMLNELETATGDQVPKNLARNLEFIKEHDFLAAVLKPESISVLVTAMRKSYGYIVHNKTEKSKKKAVQTAKVNDVLDSLGTLSF